MTQPTQTQSIETHYTGPFPATLADGAVLRSPADYTRWLATQRQAHDSKARRVQTHDGEHSGYTICDVLAERAEGAHATDAVDAVEVVDVANRPDILLGEQVLREPAQPAEVTDAKGVEVVDLASRSDISIGEEK
jgi:hypothetical protein